MTVIILKIGYKKTIEEMIFKKNGFVKKSV